MRNQRMTQAGASLVELIIWMSLSSLLLAAVGGIFFNTTKSWLYGNTQYDVQQAARITIDTMTNDLRYGISNDPNLIGFETDLSVNANANQAIMFASHKKNDFGTAPKTYYLDKTDHQFYYLHKLPNGANSPPQLVLKNSLTSGITFMAPDDGKVFLIKTASDGKKTSVTIHFKVATAKDTSTPFTINTTVTLLDAFLTSKNTPTEGGK